MLPFLTQPAVAPACYVPRYRLTQSQVFRGGQYLSRTPTVAGNRQTWTFSAWVHRAKLGAVQDIFVGGADSDYVDLQFLASDALQIRYVAGSAVASQKATSAIYRDIGGWYHVVLTLDTTNATAADRIRLHLNGVRVTSFSESSDPAHNAQPNVNAAGNLHCIGEYLTNNYNFHDGGLADVAFVDGAALPSSSFGEINIHGVWVPKPKAEIHAAITAAGGWGVNGFHLDFALPLDPGHDVSGNGNHWTATGFDSTGKDTVASSPTNVYAALDANRKYGTPTISGLRATLSFNHPIYDRVYCGLGVRSGRWAWRSTIIQVGPQAHIGLSRPDVVPQASQGLGGFAGEYAYLSDGRMFIGGALSAYGAAYTTGDVVETLLDLDTGTLRYRKNGVDQGIAASGLSGWFYPAWGTGDSSLIVDVDFGQRGYTAPPGYKTPCTDNLPEPDIKDPAEAFAQVTATGADLPAVLDAATAHWNGQWVEIIKRREASEDWRWRFSDDPANAIASNNANAKAAAPALTAAGAYVGYRLRIGKRYGVWTGEVEHTTGTATTVTHGLGTARTWVLATRVSVGGGDRYVWHPDLPAGRLLKLNATDFFTDATLTAFGADSFRIDATAPSGTYRVLVLAERSGFIHLGKYGGNSSTNGAFASCDVSPDFFLTKEFTVSGSNSGWFLALSALTGGANPAKCLFPNWGTWTESTAYPMDLTVNGVKLRYADGDPNQSGRSYVTIAIGRPIGGVCVAPATAR